MAPATPRQTAEPTHQVPDDSCSSTFVKRQAIVIIHGMGEQRPLGTLKSFVDSFRAAGTFYSKPERLTSSFEARRIKLRKMAEKEVLSNGDNWIETDFYEYYWAHLMFGARWRDLLAWGGRVLMRAWRAAGTSDETNPRIRRARTSLLALTSGLVVTFTALIALLGLRPVAIGTLGLFGLVALYNWLSVNSILRVVGDVSRYLDVAPLNIARRHEILQGGIDLLQSLHSERSDIGAGDPATAPYVYDRIVVVGHSLGSVIGYELIKHYWARVNRYLTFTDDPVLDSLLQLEEVPAERTGESERYQQLQFPLWRDLRDCANTHAQPIDPTLAPPRWLVTDFVTLGSPLTYARILLADSPLDFSEKLGLRELPTCPPNRSARDRPGGFAVHLWYEAVGQGLDKTLIPHHAAPFAPTRWTNFYFKSDPVGGPLEDVFGHGIRECPLEPKDLQVKRPWWARRFAEGCWLHTQYWPPFIKNGNPELLAILKVRDQGEVV